MERSVDHHEIKSIRTAAAALTSDQTVIFEGSIAGQPVPRGRPVPATVVLRIESGMYVNSSEPGSESAVPTIVRVKVTGAKVDSLTYPPGKDRRFSFSESPINVYSGRVTFRFALTVALSFSEFPRRHGPRNSDHTLPGMYR